MPSVQSLRRKLLKKTKDSLKQHFSSFDYSVSKAVSLLDSLDYVLNLLSEQAVEWYYLHFPELFKATDSETVLKLALELGDRKNFSKKSLSNPKILRLAENSSGSSLSADSISQIQVLCRNYFSLKTEREELEKFIEKQMLSNASNISKVCGSILGARLLEKAGSLKALAFMPSSKIQLLGAKKAFLEFKKRGKNPPKHGVIFYHPSIQNAEKKQRGAIARKLSGKIAIAARKDYFK